MSRYPGTELVVDKEMVVDMLQLEQAHSRRLKSMKIAVLYVKPGQTDMKQIFDNKPDPDGPFYRFLDNIAERVSMAEWPHYRGDMGKSGEVSARLSLCRHCLIVHSRLLGRGDLVVLHEVGGRRDPLPHCAIYERRAASPPVW